MTIKAAIPPHLDRTPWLVFQLETALSLTQQIEQQLRKLKANITAKQVHDTRVALRRFFSVWSVLKKDGWSSKSIKRRAVKKMQNLLKLLGQLRDWDVNLELAVSLKCPKTLVSLWTKERNGVQKLVRKQIRNFDVNLLVKYLTRHLQKQAQTIKEKILPQANGLESAYKHMDRHLTKQENKVKEIESKAITVPELHKLRLSIKRWRYLLTEFFGLTNLQLVRAQQLLGKLNDLNRIKTLLTREHQPKVIMRINREEKRLLAQFSTVRKNLPWGLRPVCISI